MDRKTHVKSPSKGDLLVSTVLLPTFWHEREYETMVFSCDEHGEVTDFREMYCERYSFLTDALDGHERWVKHMAEE